MEPYEGTGPLDQPLRSEPPIPNPTCQNHVSSNPMESLKKRKKKKVILWNSYWGKKIYTFLQECKVKHFQPLNPPSHETKTPPLQWRLQKFCLGGSLKNLN